MKTEELRNAAIRDWAEDKYAIGSNNDIEIDADAVVSAGDDGAFVAAWVYVRYEDMEDDENE